MTASRISHSTWSNGCVPSSVKWRLNASLPGLTLTSFSCVATSPSYSKDPGEGPWTDGLTSPWGQLVENHTGVIRGFSPRQSKLSSASTDIVPHVVGHGPRRGRNHNMLWSKTEPERQSGL